MPADSKKNGIITGYRIRYTEKNWLPKIWQYFDIGKPSTRLVTLQPLKKYTIYEFSVAANTSAGAGVYSPAVEMRTKEDGNAF